MTANQTPVDAPDIKGRLRNPMGMSQFANRDALYRELNDQRNDAADCIEALEHQLEAAADRFAGLEQGLFDDHTKAAMYEHIRTMNPREFNDLWTENLCGFETFDDLILEDMGKRKEQL